MDNKANKAIKKSRHQNQHFASLADFCRKTGARREVISRRLKKYGLTLDEYISQINDEMNDAIGGVIGANTAMLTMNFGFGAVMLVRGKAGLQICTTRRVLTKIDGDVTVHDVWQKICQTLAHEGHDPFAVNDEMCAMYIKTVSANAGYIEFNAVHV